MQAGFARPLPPEQLYAAPTAPANVPLAEPPVSQAIIRPTSLPRPSLPKLPRPSIPGWTQPASSAISAGNPPKRPRRSPASDFYSFADAERARTENESDVKPRNPFAALARKARDFVGVDADEDTRSIRDWQPTVPVHKAFHEPVYPKNSNHHQEGPSV